MARRRDDGLWAAIRRAVLALWRHVLDLMSTAAIEGDGARHQLAADELDQTLRELLHR